MKLNIEQMRELEYALYDVVGYMTDNSCGDKDCCGGPFYTLEGYQAGVEVLAKYGLDISDE